MVLSEVLEGTIIQACSEIQQCSTTIPVPINFCLSCNLKLASKNDSYSSGVIYYSAKQPEECWIETKKCKECGASFLPSYWYDSSSTKHFYVSALSASIIHFSRESVFESRLLKTLDFDILYKQTSFDAFTASFNAVNSNMRFKRNRHILQPMRIAEVWFHWHLLQYTNVTENKLNKLGFKNIEHLGYNRSSQLQSFSLLFNKSCKMSVIKVKC